MDGRADGGTECHHRIPGGLDANRMSTGVLEKAGKMFWENAAEKETVGAENEEWRVKSEK